MYEALRDQKIVGKIFEVCSCNFSYNNNTNETKSVLNTIIIVASAPGIAASWICMSAGGLPDM